MTMFGKEKPKKDEQDSSEILLARILALRAMLTDAIHALMRMKGSYENVVETQSVIIKLMGSTHDEYIMLTPSEEGDVKLGDLNAFSGWDLVVNNDDVWAPEVFTITSLQVPHSEPTMWDKVHVQMMCDLSSRQKIDELLRRGTHED